jgi:large subunit ribosomal protein L9
MEVILLERVEKLGRIGDVVNVKPGYARNFLLPRGKALRATDANRARFENDRARLEAENARRREVAQAESTAIDGVALVLIRQASNAGALYGSVAARDIADALVEAGHKVARQAVVMDRPIKTLGLHPVRIMLHPEVVVSVTANVARSPEEAELQAKGVDVTALDRDEAAPAAEVVDEVVEAAVEAEAAAEEAPAS